MKQRYEAAPFLTRERRIAFGVVDHKPFTWVKDKDGKTLRFATREEAQSWVDRTVGRAGADT